MIRLSGLVELPAIGKPVRSYTALNEDEADFQDEPSNQADHEGTMAKAQLMNLQKQASELYNMIGEDEGLEAWVQDKIGKASDYINSVFNHMQYEKSRPATIGSGDGAPADTETGTM